MGAWFMDPALAVCRGDKVARAAPAVSRRAAAKPTRDDVFKVM
jgi:hypothetical protein